MDIWHVDNKDRTGLMLMRTEGSNFIVIQDGEYKTVLTGRRYSLIHKIYAELFAMLADQVTLQKASILDSQFKTVNEIYLDLNIQNVVDFSSIRTLDSKGLKIWRTEGYMFVSGDLKNELVKIHDGLEFSLGVSQFGGITGAVE